MNTETLTTISNLATNYKVNELINLRNGLLIERMKMDKFFSLFLDKFERQMDPEKPNSNIWNLYRKKMKEYEELQRAIRSSEYYIGKFKNV